MTGASRPLPTPDRDSEPFWRGVGEGQLRLQRCEACGTWRWPARAVCGRCRSFDATWTAVSGMGRVASWVTTHQVFAAAYRDAVPYDVVEVVLDEQDDLRMIGNLVGAAKASPGLRVRAVCSRAGDAAGLVHWEPVRDEGDGARQPRNA